MLLAVDDVQSVRMAEETKRKPEALKDLERRRRFSTSLCLPEWMIEIPPDLNTNWLVMPRPEGKRYILSSKRGRTVLRSVNGYSKVVKSNLPGSVYKYRIMMMISLNYRGNCVLDVILGEKSVFVMDVIYFNNVDYGESEADSRFFTVTSRVTVLWFIDS